MESNNTLSKGPMNVERWTQGFLVGVKRWKGVEQQRHGLGDNLRCNGAAFCEMNYTLREIRMRIKLPKTHQQRAIAMNKARGIKDPQEAQKGWVELSVDSDAALQDALTLARQAYMETQR